MFNVDTDERLKLKQTMARPLRIQYLGAVYHATSWGSERSDNFRSDDDR